jgi:hypothetical protein
VNIKSLLCNSVPAGCAPKLTGWIDIEREENGSVTGSGIYNYRYFGPGGAQQGTQGPLCFTINSNTSYTIYIKFKTDWVDASGVICKEDVEYVAQFNIMLDCDQKMTQDVILQCRS